MLKFEDYIPDGYRPHLVRNIPQDIISKKAIELGMLANTVAPAVALAMTGERWTCLACKKQTQLISFNQGFREYCSKKCSNNSPEVKAEKDRVNIARYGFKNPTKSTDIRSKISNTKKDNFLPTKRNLIKFLDMKQIDFKDIDLYLSLNSDKVRIYPLDHIKKYEIKNAETRNYFQNISIANEKLGIRTIWVKPWEFLSGSRKRVVIESTIATISGRIAHQFNGRDCVVRELEPTELRPFLETNSFYGYRSASINLGLYLKKDIGEFKKNTLLMLYSFGHPFFGGKKKKYDLEVIRASTLLNCQVRGGASKLFKHFITHFETIEIGNKIVDWSNIVYYVDFDHNNGNSLPHLGFSFNSYSSPGFMNVDSVTGEASHRKPMEHKLIKEKIANGEMFSVPNAGVKIYMYNKANSIGTESIFVGE